MAPFEVTTVAGSGERGHLDGLGVAVKFSFPGGVTCDSVGNLVVVDNNSIRKVHANGAVTTLAGSPGLSDYQDGVGATARFNSPQGLAADRFDNLYVADCENHCIRKITPGGIVTMLAGSIGDDEPGYVDGLSAAARFDSPFDVAVDDDSIYQAFRLRDGVLWLATAASNINWGFLRRKTQPGRLWIYFTQLQLYAMPNPLKRRRESGLVDIFGQVS